MSRTFAFIAGLIVLACGGLYWYFTASGEEELYLLPNSFTGIVVLIFNQQSGKPRVYEQGKRVYQIPESGILHTQFPPNTGWHPLPSFYYLHQGKRVLLGHLAEKQVSSMQSGIAQSSDQAREVQFMSCLIGRSTELDSLYALRERLDYSTL
jgi:hypothetical protein